MENKQTPARDFWTVKAEYAATEAARSNLAWNDDRETLYFELSKKADRLFAEMMSVMVR